MFVPLLLVLHDSSNMKTRWFSSVYILNLNTDLPVLPVVPNMAVVPEPAVSNDEVPQQLEDNDSSRYSRHMSWIQYRLFRKRVDDNVCNQNYPGKGTDDDPYIVDYLHNDHQDAMNFSYRRKWAIAIFQSLSTFVVTFSSSVYVSCIGGIEQRFNVSGEVATLGLSLFVLGFAVGPLFWAPLSEMYGRKSIYVISFMAYTSFSVAAACSPNIKALLVLRFFASAFGSSSMKNTGGVIADMFSKEQRGLATGLFVTAPFLGPALGRWWMTLRCHFCHYLPSLPILDLLILIKLFFSFQGPLPVAFLLRPRAGVGLSV